MNQIPKLKIARSIILLAVLIQGLSGCASISEGVTRALLDKNDEPKEIALDNLICSIKGPEFPGLESYIQHSTYGDESRNQRTTKLLMVHGIGRHIPGYSSRLSEHLIHKLVLNKTEEKPKLIHIVHPNFPDESLGQLSVSRYFNDASKRELLFYELTWSSITDPEKQAISYDDSGEQTHRRANLNALMKGFLNSHISDPMIYLGNSHSKILHSVLQSTCWMTHSDWGKLPANATQSCYWGTAEDAKNLDTDDYVFVTHSLGSRITVDALQHAVELANEKQAQSVLLGDGETTADSEISPKTQNLASVSNMLDSLRNKHFLVFMLANQLPLLQLGRSAPEIHNQTANYCPQDSEMSDHRFLKKLSIVAFSDPNDLMSYSIPPNFKDKYMDSRLCPQITNVILNVAEVVPILGLGEIANPLAAHGNYDNDERVIGLITNGLGQSKTDEKVEQHCDWLQTMPTF